YLLPISSYSCYLLFHRYRSHRDPYSSPTRRSSDLAKIDRVELRAVAPGLQHRHKNRNRFLESTMRRFNKLERPLCILMDARRSRSEEHTSELQSRENIVCRLLLEKKNSAATDITYR